MTIYGALQPKANVDRLYIKCKNGGRDLINVQDCVESKRRTLREYLANSDDDLLRYAGQNIGICAEIQNNRKAKIFKELEVYTNLR